MAYIADLIDRALTHRDDQDALDKIQNEVIELTKKFPLYKEGAKA